MHLNSLRFKSIYKCGRLVEHIHSKTSTKPLLKCIDGRICEVLCTISTQQTDEKCFDLVIVGGGIVGLATAQELKTRMPELSIAVLEKESKVAAHQSGHNSGVIHAGVYYKPGSLRAKLCVEGLKLTYEYCAKHSIPYKKCGKLIVATNKVEVERLGELFTRGQKNGVPDIRLLKGSEIQDIEPHCKGLQAIHSPHTGIVDWGYVCEHYARRFKRMGGEVFLNFKVVRFDEAREGIGTEASTSSFPIVICGSRSGQTIRAGNVLTCGGLHSDKLAEMTGGDPEPKIIPFRGEYMILSEEKSNLVNGNIYPVPDPTLPFLGVHFTPRMNGEIWLGPNAMLAFKKEGYSYSDINLSELYETLKYQGFQRFIFKYFFSTMGELRKSLIINEQVKELQRYVPEVQASDVFRGPAGVRAQAMDSQGNLVEDFIFGGKGRILHCRNAPSPAATSSLAIGKVLADKVQQQFKEP